MLYLWKRLGECGQLLLLNLVHICMAESYTCRMQNAVVEQLQKEWSREFNARTTIVCVNLKIGKRCFKDSGLCRMNTRGHEDALGDGLQAEGSQENDQVSSGSRK